MKIIEIKPSDFYEGQMSITVITATKTKEISFGRGEPEDMNLARDLNQAFSIKDLIQMAYEAGKNGESIEIESLIEDEEDL